MVNAGKVIGIQSWTDVDARGKELCELRTRVEEATAKMNGELDSVKAKWEGVIRPAQEEIVLREKGIEDFCRVHQKEFGASRTRALTWVTVAFRLSSRLATLPRWTWAKVLEALREAGERRFIRVREEPDKEAIRAAGLSDEEMRKVGLRVIQEDLFSVEPVKQEVRNG